VNHHKGSNLNLSCTAVYQPCDVLDRCQHLTARNFSILRNIYDQWRQNGVWSQNADIINFDRQPHKKHKKMKIHFISLLLFTKTIQIIWYLPRFVTWLLLRTMKNTFKKIVKSIFVRAVYVKTKYQISPYIQFGTHAMVIMSGSTV